MQIVSVSVGWQIYDLTRDAFNLGMVGLVQFLPALLLVLVTGAAADRFGRRFIMGLSLILESVVTALLLCLTLAGLFEPLTVFAALTLLVSPARFSAHLPHRWSSILYRQRISRTPFHGIHRHGRWRQSWDRLQVACSMAFLRSRPIPSQRCSC